MTGAGYQPLPSRESEETCVSMDGHEKVFDKHGLAHSSSSPDQEAVRVKRKNQCLLFKALLCLVLIASTAFAACCVYRRGGRSAMWTNRPITAHHPSTTSLGSDSNIVFGLGIGDVTGPVVEVNMMGYASLPQTNTGLHIRLRSRAFIVGSDGADAPSS